MEITKLQFTFSLNLDQVNLIINSLAKLPYEQVADLIIGFRQNAVSTIQAAEAAERESNQAQQPANDPVPNAPADAAPVAAEETPAEPKATELPSETEPANPA